ncbi:MAG: hypothetical protein ABIY62_08900, partial [Ginsengibacter sp.]
QLAYKKRNVIKNTIRIFISIYIFSVVKVYIIISYLPAFIIFLLLKNAMLVKNKLGKILLVMIFISGSIFAFVQFSDTMIGSLGKYAGDNLAEGISARQENFNTQSKEAEGSFFSLGVTFDGTVSSLVKMAPAALVATLFRPFLWESRNVSTLLSSLESLAIMLLTLIVIVKVGIWKFCGSIVKYPIILYCFFFSMVFAIFVGATTLNFGTLVRYKIPAMPFYVISLLLILYYNNKIKSEEVKKDLDDPVSAS